MCALGDGGGVSLLLLPPPRDGLGFYTLDIPDVKVTWKYVKKYVKTLMNFLHQKPGAWHSSAAELRPKLVVTIRVPVVPTIMVKVVFDH